MDFGSHFGAQKAEAGGFHPVMGDPQSSPWLNQYLVGHGHPWVKFNGHHELDDLDDWIYPHLIDDLNPLNGSIPYDWWIPPWLDGNLRIFTSHLGGGGVAHGARQLPDAQSGFDGWIFQGKNRGKPRVVHIFYRRIIKSQFFQNILWLVTWEFSLKSNPYREANGWMVVVVVVGATLDVWLVARPLSHHHVEIKFTKKNTWVKSSCGYALLIQHMEMEITHKRRWFTYETLPLFMALLDYKRIRAVHQELDQNLMLPARPGWQLPEEALPRDFREMELLTAQGWTQTMLE